MPLISEAVYARKHAPGFVKGTRAATFKQGAVPFPASQIVDGRCRQADTAGPLPVGTRVEQPVLVFAAEHAGVHAGPNIEGLRSGWKNGVAMIAFPDVRLKFLLRLIFLSDGDRPANCRSSCQNSGAGSQEFTTVRRTRKLRHGYLRSLFFWRKACGAGCLQA